MPKTACFCNATLDYFPQQDRHYPGGNSLNQALWFRHMDQECAFVGALGTDEAGDRVEVLLRSSGTDVSCLYRLPGYTARNKIINDDAGERYGVEGAWEGGVYETYIMTESDWSYIKDFPIWATHSTGPNFTAALQKKADQLLCVDFLHLMDKNQFESSLPRVDIAYLGGTPDMEDYLHELAQTFSGIIVLTLGAGGSMAFQGDRIFRQQALPAQVVDTTGCGDAFQAGFTTSWHLHRDIPTALAAGAELGKSAAGHYGGVPHF